ncbi:hypothetical protein AACH06_25570 [Ideonella sp. DXS29W]|uniref:Peptidase M41 domain-containing protein n=1 Tax=Ideonella lacteola TaxID=2984193 RepID=A0ABU9BW58_9BURK
MNVEAQYNSLPMSVVACHEAGHAAVAHHLGGQVHLLIFGRNRSGRAFARVSYSVSDLHRYKLVLSAGMLAVFLNDQALLGGDASWGALWRWVNTETGYVRAISGASDWIEILRCSNERPAQGITEFLDRAVRPYFDETVAALRDCESQASRLRQLILSRRHGLGPRSLKRFFAGESAAWDDWLDWPRVRVATALQAMRG